MTQTTSTSTSTRTPTRASCTSEHALRARSLRCTPLDVVSYAPHGSRCSRVSSHPHSHPCASLFDFTFLPFYFDLTFSVLMHPEQHTELDNLNTVQHNLRNSAKGSNDAYDVHTSLTVSVAADLFDFSLHFISFLIISLITLQFLLPDILQLPS